MEKAGMAAGTLLMLNAEKVNTGSRDNDGWETLEIPNFGEGALELARMVVGDFNCEFSSLATELRNMIDKIRNVKEPINCDMRTLNWDPVTLHYGNRDYLHFEDVNGSLRNCICLLGDILSDRKGSRFQVDHLTTHAIEEKLDDCFNALWATRHRVHRAFASLMASRVGEREV